MTNFLIVGLGGALGSMGRYGLLLFVEKTFSHPWFPYATLSSNIVGCILIGLLRGLNENKGYFSDDVALFLFIGVLGGFTTFSAFGFETFKIANEGHIVGAVINVAVQLTVCLLGVVVGYSLSKYF